MPSGHYHKLTMVTGEQWLDDQPYVTVSVCVSRSLITVIIEQEIPFDLCDSVDSTSDNDALYLARSEESSHAETLISHGAHYLYWGSWGRQQRIPQSIYCAFPSYRRPLSSVSCKTVR